MLFEGSASLVQPAWTLLLLFGTTVTVVLSSDLHANETDEVTSLLNQLFDESENCNTRSVDLGFLVEGNQDGTTEEKETAFTNAMEFVKKMARTMKVSDTGTHIGLVVYGKKPSMAFDFNEYSDVPSMSEAIDRVKQPTDGHMTGQALAFVKDKLYDQSGRPGVPKALVVVVSKKSGDMVTQGAYALKKSGAKIYTVGIGPDSDPLEMNDVASEIQDTFITDDNHLSSLVKKLVPKICADVTQADNNKDTETTYDDDESTMRPDQEPGPQTSETLTVLQTPTDPVRMVKPEPSTEPTVVQIPTKPVNLVKPETRTANYTFVPEVQPTADRDSSSSNEYNDVGLGDETAEDNGESTAVSHDGVTDSYPDIPEIRNNTEATSNAADQDSSNSEQYTFAEPSGESAGEVRKNTAVSHNGALDLLPDVLELKGNSVATSDCADQDDSNSNQHEDVESGDEAVKDMKKNTADQDSSKSNQHTNVGPGDETDRDTQKNTTVIHSGVSGGLLDVHDIPNNPDPASSKPRGNTIHSDKDVQHTRLKKPEPPAGNARARLRKLADKICMAKADIGILVDGSSTVGSTKFAKMLEFTKSLTKSFSVSRNGTHVAVATAAQGPHMSFDLEGFNDEQSIETAVTHMSYMGGPFLLGSSLTGVKTSWFKNSGRKSIPQLLLVLATTPSADDIVAPSRELRDRGVRIETLGIGTKFDGAQLKEIATHPAQDHVMAVSKFELLPLIRPILTVRICRAVGGKLVSGSNTGGSEMSSTPTVENSAATGTEESPGGMLGVEQNSTEQSTTSQEETQGNHFKQAKQDKQVRQVNQESKVLQTKLATRLKQLDQYKKTREKMRTDTGRTQEYDELQKQKIRKDIRRKLYELLRKLGGTRKDIKAAYRSIIFNINGHFNSDYCKDTHKLCKEWANNNLCDRGNEAIDSQSVQRVCPKSCEVCF